MLCGSGAAAWAQAAPTGRTPDTGKPPGAGAGAETERPITKEQAKELFRSVDEILKFVSADTKLPIQHSVKRKLISRDEVNKFLRTKFDEDEGAKRLEREQLVLKKFGLLDQDFDLRPFLISLLTEQIAGFYDNKTKTVNLLDWIQPEEQKPVLAHELTHALQDQAVDLERWGDSGVHGISTDARQDSRHIETDELETAREAVAEGQAMAVFVDWGLRSTGKTIADAPGLADRLKEVDSGTGGSPVLARAPLLLQRSLLFPYSDGLSFEQAVLVKGGKEAAFADVLARPPSSSWEILHPEAYLTHAPVPVLRLPDVHPLLDAEYAPYDVGVMGALDVDILAELFGGREMAEALTPAWDGGIYFAAQRRSATAAEKTKTGSVALFYLSRWKNPDSAKSFARVYAEQLGRKYTKIDQDTKDAKDDEAIYTTNEGDVLVSRSGREVWVSEGFALPMARQLRQMLLEAQPAGPVMSAGVRGPEPAMGLARVYQELHAAVPTMRDMLVAGPAQGIGLKKEQRVW